MNNPSHPILLLLALFPGLVQADMFSWKDPQTGQTRMSNIAPPWLREGGKGPKVEVIRDGRSIDPATAFTNPQAPAEMSNPQRARAGLPPKPQPPAGGQAANEDDD